MQSDLLPSGPFRQAGLPQSKTRQFLAGLPVGELGRPAVEPGDVGDNGGSAPEGRGVEGIDALFVTLGDDVDAP